MIQGGNPGSFSSDICRLLQLCEEEDDATSPLAAPKPEPTDQSFQVGETVVFHEVGFVLLYCLLSYELSFAYVISFYYDSLIDCRSSFDST